MRAEVVSALRREAAAGGISAARVRMALVQLSDLALVEFPFQPFQPRVWELRHDLGVYDAWYVALAEELEADLVTLDGRLAATPAIRCDVALITSQ